jgi:hypothetical protein
MRVGSRAPSGGALGKVAVAGCLLAGAGGCGRSLDMASAYDADRAPLTVPYTGVREEVRLYPDYGPIDGTILREGSDAAGAKPSADGAKKKGKSP